MESSGSEPAVTPPASARVHEPFPWCDGIVDMPCERFFVVLHNWVAEILPCGDYGPSWDADIYEPLIAAGYPDARDPDVPMVDVHVTNDRHPRVIAHHTSPVPAERETDMGEASVVFLRWLKEHAT